MGVQKVRWDKGGTVFSMEKETKINQLGTGIFLHQRTISAIKRVEFVGDRVSYIVLRGRWCNIIVLNVHATSEEKSDDSNTVCMRN